VARAMVIEAGFSCMDGTRAAVRTHALLEEARRQAERCGHPHVLAMVAAIEGVAQAAEGDFRAGARRTEDALPLLRAYGTRWDVILAEYLPLMMLSLAGDLAQIEERVDLLEREARASDDRLMLANICNGYPALVRLLHDDVARARALSDETMRGWSQAGFHRQHYYYAFAQVNLDLYEGEVERAWARVRDVWWPLERSLLFRSQLVRISALNLRARAALATGRCEQVARDATRLEREGADWATGFAALLRACLAPTPQAFLRAGAMLEAAGVRMHAAVARRRAGADDPWWLEQGVANPAGFVRCFAPRESE
jgi:eukaryotic-like serine/threonine-protein kinase